jgi:hypothetical protein
MPVTRVFVHTRLAGDDERMRSASRCEISPAPFGG